MSVNWIERMGIRKGEYEMAYRNILGKRGEEIAKEYLISKGYYIVQTNFRCKIGEIDIIARKDDYLIFVEVKTRINENYGKPVESISQHKVKKIIYTAKVYLSMKKQHDINVRFDVIEVMVDNNGGVENRVIEHIENAFWER